MRAPSTGVLLPHNPRHAVEFFNDGQIGAGGHILDGCLVILFAPVAGGHVDPIDVGYDFVGGWGGAFQPGDFPPRSRVALLGDTRGDAFGELGELGL